MGCTQVAQLGSEHPDTATTMANTAGLLKAMGRHADAETVYRTVRFSRMSNMTCVREGLCLYHRPASCTKRCLVTCMRGGFCWCHRPAEMLQEKQQTAC